MTDAPSLLVALFAVITQLGDAWFLFVGLSLLYWFGPGRAVDSDRAAAATAVAIAVGALALTLVLKGAFAIPRPTGADAATPPAWIPVPLAAAYVDAATATGYGFPSGHALGTTAVYGGVALLADVWDRHRRLLAAGGVVALVGLSRVVLGVHYPVDVVAGVLAGVAYLALVLRYARRPDRAFALAALAGVAAFAVGLRAGSPHQSHEAAAAIGAALGGLVAWRYGGPYRAQVGPLVAVVGLAVTVALWVASLVLHPPLSVTVLTNAAAVGVVLALPSASALLEENGAPRGQKVSR